MSRTHFHDDHRRIVHDRAYSYEKSGTGFRALPLNYANAGATSLFTTASDLARWLDNFRDPKVGGRAAIDRLQEQAVLADGTRIDYALGLAIGRYRGLKTISHGGSDAGYRSFVLWFPDQELGVAVVSGLASFDSGGTANKVAEVFLGGQMSSEAAQAPQQPPPQNPHPYITLDPAALDQYIGHYKLDAGFETDVRKQGGKLVAEVPGQGTQELHPLATNRFFIEQVGGEVEFLSKPDGPLHVKLTQEGSTFNGERTSLTPWDATDLEQYEGTYWSDELETQYTFRLKGHKLMADHVRHGEIRLLSAGRDRFTTTEWFMPEVNFRRDASNRVSEVTLGGGRVVGIRFSRKGAAPPATPKP
jgi:hypothetical protein